MIVDRREEHRHGVSGIIHRRYARCPFPSLSLGGVSRYHIHYIVIILRLTVNELAEGAFLVFFAAPYRAGEIITGLRHHISKASLLHYIEYLEQLILVDSHGNCGKYVLSELESLYDHGAVKVTGREYTDALYIGFLFKKLVIALVHFYSVGRGDMASSFFYHIRTDDLFDQRMIDPKIKMALGEFSESDNAYADFFHVFFLTFTFCFIFTLQV